jgi:hypothetical protein
MVAFVWRNLKRVAKEHEGGKYRFSGEKPEKNHKLKGVAKIARHMTFMDLAKRFLRIGEACTTPHQHMVGAWTSPRLS